MLHRESLAEVELAADRIVQQEVLVTLTLHATLEDQVRAVGDCQRFADIVIGIRIAKPMSRRSEMICWTS